MRRSTGPISLFSPRARFYKCFGDHQAGDVEEPLIDSQDAVVADLEAAIGLQPSEGAVDFPALVMAPQIVATLSTNLFRKTTLE